jgi:MFS family permease
MLEKQSRQVFGIDAKTVFTSVMLVANPLVWYYTVNIVLQDVVAKISTDPSTAILVWGAHFFGIIASALVGAFLAKKIEQTRFLTFWMTLGVLSSLAMFLINTADVLSVSLIALLFGVSLGVGMPTCMKYFTNYTPVEKRGRVSGMVMLAFTMGMAMILLVPNDTLITGIVLAVWRLSSLIIFRLRPPLNRIKQKESTPSYRLILSQQSFILYFIPWVMFPLVNYLTTPVQSNLVGENIVTSLMLLQNWLMGIFAVIGGFLLDYIGRKRVAVAGFVLVGIGTSVIGAYPDNVLSWYFSAVTGGIAWGFFFVVFILTIWGDLSGNTRSDKYYALGVTPFFASQFLEIVAGKYFADIIPAYALFSFTVFFLFLAVLPLAYAPETLPEKALKDRDLKSYTEKALKQAQKEAEKSQKKGNSKKEPPKTEGEADKNDEANEEARKLAEKYY